MNYAFFSEYLKKPLQKSSNEAKQALEKFYNHVWEKVVFPLKKQVKDKIEVINRKKKELEKLLSKYVLPPNKTNHKYTLVLDLDETLVHYVEEEGSAYILIRPGAEQFVEELSQFYEIIVFTAATQDVMII